MMTLSDVRRRLATILAVVMVVVLVACAGTSDEGSSGSSGERTPCDECEASCEDLQGEEKADCIERCMQDCLP
jgi:hypothetical protein